MLSLLLLLLFLVSPSSSLLILRLPFRLIALRRLGIQRREAETGVGNDCHDLVHIARGLYWRILFRNGRTARNHTCPIFFFSSFTIYTFARPSQTTSDDDPGSVHFHQVDSKRTPLVSLNDVLNAGLGCFFFFFFQLLDFGVDKRWKVWTKNWGMLVTMTMMNGH